MCNLIYPQHHHAQRGEWQNHSELPGRSSPKYTTLRLKQKKVENPKWTYIIWEHHFHHCLCLVAFNLTSLTYSKYICVSIYVCIFIYMYVYFYTLWSTTVMLFFSWFQTLENTGCSVSLLSSWSLWRAPMQWSPEHSFTCTIAQTRHGPTMWLWTRPLILSCLGFII